MQVELCEIPLAGAPLPPPKCLPAARGFGRRGYAQAGAFLSSLLGHPNSSQGKVTPDVALDGIPPFEYFYKKRGRSDETLIAFTFS